MNDFVVSCRSCKTRFTIPDQGPCTDLEYMDYIKMCGKQCRCGKNDWEVLT